MNFHVWHSFVEYTKILEVNLFAFCLQTTHYHLLFQNSFVEYVNVEVATFHLSRQTLYGNEILVQNLKFAESINGGR